MKILKVFSVLIVLLVSTIYIILFTPFGNSLLKPVIEGKIHTATLLDAKLNKFLLTTKSLSLDLQLTPKNSILVNANYSLIHQTFNLLYSVHFQELNELQKLTKTKLYGQLNTQGSAKGDLDLFDVDGLAAIAKGDLHYKLKIKEFNPVEIQANGKNLQIDSLLHMAAQKPYAKGLLSLNADFKNIQPHNLDGDIHLKTTHGTFNSTILQNDFNITLPQTTFDLDLNALLKKEDIDYTFEFLSNLAKITTKGTLKPAISAFDINYNAAIKELALFKPLTKQNFQGKFNFHGILKGDRKKAQITFFSDMANSNTQLQASLKNLKPTKVTAKIENLHLDKLLYMLGQAPYAEAIINCNVNLDNLNPKQLHGNLKLWSKQGVFNSHVIKKELGINIPKTSFTLTLATLLKQDHILYNTLFDSNLIQLDSKGTIYPEPLKMDLQYQTKIKELALLKPLTNADIRGRLKANGTIKGTKELLYATVHSDIANSNTLIKTTLKEFQPNTLEASIKNLQLSKLLYMLKQPNYTSGTLDLVADIKSLQQNDLKGSIEIHSQGKLNTAYLTKAYNFKQKMPATSFILQTTTTLNKTDALSKITLDSTLANIQMPKAIYNIQKKSFHTNYTLDIPSLKQLYFATNQKLNGDFKATGKIQQDKSLTFTMDSHLAEGELHMQLKDKDLDLTIAQMKTKKLLYILNYPDIVDGDINSKVHYNLLQQKGIISASLSNGYFRQNLPFDLLKKYDKIDLYKEKFAGDLHAKIKQELINANFALQSRKATISSKKTLINTKKELIDAAIFIKTKNSPIHLTLKGDLKQPKVGVNLKEFLETKAGKKLEEKANKEINRFLKKLF